MQVSNIWLSFGLVTVSGSLWFFAVAPFDFYGIAWFAAVPMLAAVDRAPSYRRALLLGWWAGAVETAGGFYWLIDLLQRFAGFPWAGACCVFLLFCALRGLIFLLFTAIVCFVRRRVRLPMTALAPLAMVTCEWAVPQLFPSGQWITQAWQPLVIQISEFTGPLGVTALLMLVNGTLYDVLADGRHACTPAMAAAGLLAGALTFGMVRMRQVDALIVHAPQLHIGLVQPNFADSIDVDLSREEALRQLAALQEQSRRLEHAGAELIVWSEGAYPMALPHDLAADFSVDSPGMIRRGITGPLIIGASTYDVGHQDAFNTALLLDRGGGVAGRYDKVRLLAFGEYVPGVKYFPWLRNLLPAGAGRTRSGPGPGNLAFNGPAGRIWRIAPVICYEDLLPEYLTKVGALHPNLLVNMTSDSWYGAAAEPWQHLALAVFASVELRVSMVRAVNSGISALIDPNGRVLQKTYANDPRRTPRAADGLLVAAPGMPGGYTAFVRYGNWFAYLCIGATAAAAAWARRHAHPSPRRA